MDAYEMFKWLSVLIVAYLLPQVFSYMRFSKAFQRKWGGKLQALQNEIMELRAEVKQCREAEAEKTGLLKETMESDPFDLVVQIEAGQKAERLKGLPYTIEQYAMLRRARRELKERKNGQPPK